MAGRNRSNEDNVRSISKSIFITNFPDSTTSADLWKLCQAYGSVVDVFIPNRRSKEGKRFAFARFIKVQNVDRLVGNLCTLWIDFVSRERIVWVDIEGIPLHAWSRNTFLKIRAKWGEVLDLEEETDYSSDDELAKDEGINQFEPSQQVNLEEESDDEVVSDTHFGDNMEKEGTSNESVINSGVKGNSGDPFKIYDLLNKSKKVVETIDSDTSIPFPPGFTPNLETPKEDEQHLNMGGIMCAWDHSVFYKEHHTISDNFIVVFETWIPNKMKWAVEGDENSKFFHSIVNRKRANLTIKGIMVDGVWVDDPSQVAELEIPISKEEIRNAVWGCGENKYPGPDGFTFEFFRKYWHIVGTDFCLAVEWFFNQDSFPVGCNSSFIALIPKSLDPKLVWIVLKCTKITKKPDNNCTRIEATRKARTRSKFFSNKLNEAYFIQSQSLGTYLAKRSKQRPSKDKRQSPGTKSVNLPKSPEGLKLPI
nr:RNA-directed DNA polymerase, eukaryota [Tanacetum cinerariifolium]